MAMALVDPTPSASGYNNLLIQMLNYNYILYLLIALICFKIEEYI